MNPFTAVKSLIILLLCASFSNAFGQVGKPSISVDEDRAPDHYWVVHVRDTAVADKFISDAEYLIDPKGVIKKRPNADTGYTSYNVAYNPANFTLPAGLRSVDIQLVVVDRGKTAEVWFLAVNGAGQDSLVHMVYTPPLQISVDTMCDGQPRWLTHIRDTATIDSFISSVRLSKNTGHASYNVAFDPAGFAVQPGLLKRVDVSVVVQNPLKAAEAWLSTTTGIGYEVLCHLMYLPPALLFGAVTSDGVDSNGDARLDFEDAHQVLIPVRSSYSRTYSLKAV